MKTPNTIEQEINRIRLAIYEETKDMTAAQRADRTNKIAEAAAEKYDFKIYQDKKCSCPFYGIGADCGLTVPL